MSDILHSYAPLPLIPPTPFSHKGRRGSLGVLMPETGDGTQGLTQKSTPVSFCAPGTHVDRYILHFAIIITIIIFAIVVITG